MVKPMARFFSLITIMKKLILLFVAIAGVSYYGFSQKSTTPVEKSQIMEVKPNAAVKSAFDKEYPSAVDVKWTKFKDIYTAQFGSGIFRATVNYNSAGQRVDKDGNPVRKP